jgi:hypothetical protein
LKVLGYILESLVNATVEPTTHMQLCSCLQRALLGGLTPSAPPNKHARQPRQQQHPTTRRNTGNSSHGQPCGTTQHNTPQSIAAPIVINLISSNGSSSIHSDQLHSDL